MEMIDVAAALVFREGKLLITQRLTQAHLGGLWEFPGGKREPGDAFQECLSRELDEELGIEVDVQEEIESIIHEYPEKAVCLKFFRCTLRKNECQALGCLGFRWVGPEELTLFEFPAADARLLEKLQKTPELWRKNPPGSRRVRL